MVTTFADAVSILRNSIISKYPHIRRAYIFGSFAESVQGPGSDLDVIVELDSAMGLEFISLIQDIETAAGTGVDVITAEQASILERKYGYDILKEAKLVYERTGSHGQQQLY
jgi:predicted nucleotidyltransferase